jgi:hypothetical protein
VDGGDNGARGLRLSACCLIPFEPLLAWGNQPKAHVSIEGYHVSITANIRVDRMVTQPVEGEA